MPLPTVTVLLLTYEDGMRGTAVPTLRAVQEHLYYSGPLNLHIADDGSPPGHLEALTRVRKAGRAMWDEVSSSNAQRGGYGRSYNLATQYIHERSPGGIVLPLEDDWVLSRDLDLDRLVETLCADNHIECIRLGYLGFTQSLYGEVTETPAGHMLLLEPWTSREHHLFAGHPRLETVAFEKRVGPWPEGLAAGATEFEVSGRAETRYGIAWPLDVGPASMRDDSLFLHIGEHGLGEVQPGG